METLQTPLTIIGFLTTFYPLTSLTLHAYTYPRSSSLPRHLHPTKPSWALVTGATDGIGLAFAQELCQRGFNVILHGRNPQKLQKIQAQLARDYPLAKTRIVVFDASQPTGALGERVGESVRDVDLRVLINNVVGQGGLTKKTYQTLVESTGSLILNIASIAALGLLYLAVYGGSKGYVDSFTRALSAEMSAEGKQVEVMVIQVGSVQSAGNDVEEGFFIPSSRNMAKAALERVGCGRVMLCAFWPHALQVGAAEMLPERWLQGVNVWTIKALKVLKEVKEKRES